MQSSKNYVNTGYTCAECPRIFGAFISYKLSFTRNPLY